jgi:hypothetical protein
LLLDANAACQRNEERGQAPDELERQDDEEFDVRGGLAQFIALPVCLLGEDVLAAFHGVERPPRFLISPASGT